jgi:hypothetical protein
MKLFHATFRKHYAGIGFTYDPIEDHFVPVQPFPSWTLNTDSILWEAPVPRPSDGKSIIRNIIVVEGEQQLIP